MLGQLAEAGAVITADEADADVIVINTCGFLEASRNEAHEAIAQAVAQKQTGRCKRVVVAGCLVQRDGEALLKAVKGIDALVGVHQRDSIVPATLVQLKLPPKRGKAGGGAGRRTQPDLYLGEYHPHIALDTARLRLTPAHYAYLRISEGCDQKCTFCTIPSIRGPMHCKPIDVVLAEARELIADGVLELIAGTLLLFTAPDRIRQLAILVTQPELTEDPNDFIATHILRGADSLTDHVVLFTAFYLLAHGIVKVVLVAALLRNKLWAYPWMVVVLAIFILYQFYQLAVTPSAGLVALTLFDILIVVLTWHEYRRHRTRLGQKDGTA